MAGVCWWPHGARTRSSSIYGRGKVDGDVALLPGPLTIYSRTTWLDLFKRKTWAIGSKDDFCASVVDKKGTLEGPSALAAPGRATRWN